MNTVTHKNVHYSVNGGLTFGRLAAIVFVCIALSFLSPNTYPTLFALLLIPLLYVLLWRENEPPVLLLAVGIQWLQASVSVFHANISGISVEDLHEISTAGDAVVYSLVGILVIALGIRVALTNMPKAKPELLQTEIGAIRTLEVFRVYVVILLISEFLIGFVWVFAGLSQVMLHVLALKWVIFYALAVVVINNGVGYPYLFTALLIEVVLGITGFFADYQTVFLVIILALYTRVRRSSSVNVLFLISCFVFLLYFSVVWSAVKSEYRDYINLGTGHQTARVDFEDRLTKMFELHWDMDGSDYIEGLDALAKRVAYTFYFAHVLTTVPEYIPHEEGALWGNAVRHVLLPRILFPDKANLDSDTLLTDKYTGLRLMEQGGNLTNIPLGYLTESYIDYGIVFMYVPVFLVGLLFGLMYRLLLSQPCSRILSYGAVCIVFLQIVKIEIPATKMLGGALMGFLVMLVAMRFVFPFIEKALKLPTKYQS